MTSPGVRVLDSGDPELPLIEVDAGRLRAVFLPAVGGRLLSLRVDGLEVLWINPTVFDHDLRCLTPKSGWPVFDGTYASWVNVGGSKTWVAPQGSAPGEWPGPPDDVLDSGSWHLNTTTDVDVIRVEMTSPDDPRTGLRVVRSFAFRRGDAGFDQYIAFTNWSGRSVRWAPWEVAQVATEGKGAVHVAIGDDPSIRNLGHYRGNPQWSIAGGEATMSVVDGVAKFGFPSATGLCSWRGDRGQSISLEMQVDDLAAYPDGGSRVEVWAQSPQVSPLNGLEGFRPDAWLVELEMLAPLSLLEPGETSRLSIRWEVSGPGGFSANPARSPTS